MFWRKTSTPREGLFSVRLPTWRNGGDDGTLGSSKPWTTTSMSLNAVKWNLMQLATKSTISCCQSAVSLVFRFPLAWGLMVGMCRFASHGGIILSRVGFDEWRLLQPTNSKTICSCQDYSTTDSLDAAENSKEDEGTDVYFEILTNWGNPNYLGLTEVRCDVKVVS